MLHMTERALSETNSFRTTRNHSSEINTYENDINKEHKLNIDTVMNLKTAKKHFITTPKSVCRATISKLRPQKYEIQSNPYSPLGRLYL